MYIHEFMVDFHLEFICCMSSDSIEFGGVGDGVLEKKIVTSQKNITVKNFIF